MNKKNIFVCRTVRRWNSLFRNRIKLAKANYKVDKNLEEELFDTLDLNDKGLLNEELGENVKENNDVNCSYTTMFEKPTKELNIFSDIVENEDKIFNSVFNHQSIEASTAFTKGIEHPELSYSKKLKIISGAEDSTGYKDLLKTQKTLFAEVKDEVLAVKASLPKFMPLYNQGINLTKSHYINVIKDLEQEYKNKEKLLKEEHNLEVKDIKASMNEGAAKEKIIMLDSYKNKLIGFGNFCDYLDCLLLEVETKNKELCSIKDELKSENIDLRRDKEQNLKKIDELIQELNNLKLITDELEQEKIIAEEAFKQLTEEKSKVETKNIMLNGNIQDIERTLCDIKEAFKTAFTDEFVSLKIWALNTLDLYKQTSEINLKLTKENTMLNKNLSHLSTQLKSATENMKTESDKVILSKNEALKEITEKHLKDRLMISEQKSLIENLLEEKKSFEKQLEIRDGLIWQLEEDCRNEKKKSDNFLELLCKFDTRVSDTENGIKAKRVSLLGGRGNNETALKLNSSEEEIFKDK